MPRKKATADISREDLEQHIAAFLKRGGAITVIDPGVSGESPWLSDQDPNPCKRVELPARISPGMTLH